MSGAVIFIVAPERYRLKLEEMVKRQIIPARRPNIKIITDDSARDVTTNIHQYVAENLADVMSNFRSCEIDTLLFQKETKCSIKYIQRWWENEGLSRRAFLGNLSLKALEAQFKKWCETKGFHWRVHAEQQIAKYDHHRPVLDAWLQQFGELRLPRIGRYLASQLNVIRLAELVQNPFSITKSELVGQTQLYCYISDDDEGGSWGEIKSILTHTHERAKIGEVRWLRKNKEENKIDTITFPSHIVADEYVLCEDGLWSGKETVRRLIAIKAANIATPIRFKFGLVTDFGLHVARHAIRKLNLTGHVQIDTSSSEYMEFLSENVPEEIKTGTNIEIDTYIHELNKYITPHAFRDKSDWSAEMQQDCREIGAQLVQRWMLRKNGHTPRKEEVDLFAIGGGGFASTTLFARSIPKVCMPLLWLDGKVHFNDRQIQWKPLFMDSRRIGNSHLFLDPC